MKLWSALGLQIRSLALQALDDSTSVVHFVLSASGEANERSERRPADIRDLNPPCAIPVLHVSAIDLEFLLSSTEQRASQCQCPVRSSGDPCRQLSSEFRCRGKHFRLCQRALAKLQPLLLDSAYHNIGQHDAVCDRFTPLVVEALQNFFDARPIPGAKICVPRMFKSSQLAELAPGVFLPEYAHTIRPRQRLIPTLARIMASFKRQECTDQCTVDQDDEQHKSSKHVEWYEGRLWSSMVCALRMPARARPSGSAPPSTIGERYHGTCRIARDVLESYSNTEGSSEIILDKETRASANRKELEWLPLLNEANVTDDEMLELSSAEYSDDDAFLLDTVCLDEDGFVHYPQESAADMHTPGYFKLVDPCGTSTISRKPSDAELPMNAECLGEVLTHVFGQRSKGAIRDNQTHGSRDMNQRHLLVRQKDCMHPGKGSRLEEVEEDIFMLEDLYPTVPCPRPAPAIRKCDSHDRDRLLQVDHCPVLSKTMKKSFGGEGSCREAEMPSCSPCQSLPEPLGDCRILRKTWERRNGTNLLEADNMLEIHDMFENDHDVKLRTGEDQSSYDDSMLLDSFNSSRKSPSFSESCWLGSPTHESLGKAFKKSTTCSQSTQPSTEQQLLTSMSKKMKRRSSISQEIMSSARMTEDDILFQQSSPLREVDVKKRKPLLCDHQG